MRGDDMVTSRERLPLLAVVLLAGGLASPGPAQPPDRPAENATAARIADGVEKAQAGKLLDAVEQFQRVLDTAGDELVPVDRSQYTPARWVVHGLIARLPADGIKLYRARVDGQAARRLDEAKKARDDTGLNRLLADMFAARATEEAILELARRAFERGEFDAAERYWQMLLPAPAEDDHQLHFPAPKTPPAAVRARLILVKLFRGERDEAKADFQALRTEFPNAAGLLAGRTGKFVDTLAELFDDPTQTTLPPPPDEPGWPTFAGSPSRTGTNRARLPYFWPDVPTWVKPLGPKPKDAPTADPLHPRALAFHPVVVGGRVFVSDGTRVAVFDLLTGKPAEPVWADEGEEIIIPTRQDVRFTLTGADGIFYGRFGASPLQASDRKSFLMAFRPPTGATNDRPVLWRLKPPDAENVVTHFEGAPVVRSGRLFVSFWRHAGAEAQAGVACYRIDDPAATPELTWQRIVGKAGSEPNGETRYRHALVTLAGPNVVYGTDGGTVMALDAATGRPAWEYRYPRNERPTLPRYRDLCPPLADGGRIYAAPADTDRLLCLDAVTGRLIWEREGVEVIHLLGVARGRVIATFGGQGRGIRGLNVRTGADSGTGGWTIHDDGGVGTFGRGLVTEEAVVWPTRHGLRFLDPADGTQLRSSIPGPPPVFPKSDVPLPPDQPAPFGNLCYADGVLVVTTPTHVFGFVSEAKKLGDRRKAVQEFPDDPAKHADLAQSLIDAGEYAEAEAEAAKAMDANDRLRWLLAERVIRHGKRDEAKRLYEELAKGEGSFAAAGAARLAEQIDDPGRRREAWRAVFSKRGTIRDENGVPWPARTYAEVRSPELLVMRGTGVREDDVVGLIGPDPLPDPPPPRPGFVRASAKTVVHSALRAPASGEGGQARGEFEYNAAGPILASPSRPSIPAASGQDGPAGLTAVRLDGGRLSFLYGERFLGTFQPADGVGRVRSDTRRAARLHPVHSRWGELVQTIDGRMLVWLSADRKPREYPCTRKPWPEPPEHVGGNRFLIPDDGSVVLFDAKIGKELSRCTLPGPDSLTGALPRFRLHQGDALVLIERNHGVDVDRLRTDDLKRAWERSPVFVGRSLDHLAFAGDRFFTAADEMLTAHRWKDGEPAWEVPLPDGKWKLAVAPQGVLAYPAEAVLRQPHFDAVGEFRRAGWDAAALLRAAGRTYDVWADRELPVLVFDPADGRLVQRLTFPAAGPAAGVAVTPKGVVVVTGKGSWTLVAR